MAQLPNFPVYLQAKGGIAMGKKLAAIGGYGNEDSDNIFVYEVEDQNQWKLIASAMAGVRPSFLCFSDTNLLYVVNEQNLAMHQCEGLVKTYLLPSLQEMGSIPSCGEDPCFLTLDPSKKFLLTTNYSSGTVAIFPLSKAGVPSFAVQTLQFFGLPGPNKERQAWPHPHSILFDEGRSCFYVADLGTDRLHQYAWEADKAEPARFIKDLRLPLGSGPRLMRLSPDKKSLYVVNELANSVSKVNPDTGETSLVCTTLKHPNQEATAAHLEVLGDRVIVSTRGEDSILVHTDNNDSWYDCKGKCPRYFALEGNTLFIANQLSDSIVRFHLDAGAMQDVLNVPKPTCIQFKDI